MIELLLSSPMIKYTDRQISITITQNTTHQQYVDHLRILTILESQLECQNCIEIIKIVCLKWPNSTHLNSILNILATKNIKNVNCFVLNLYKMPHIAFSKVIDNLQQARMLTRLDLKNNQLTNQTIQKIVNCRFRFVCIVDLSYNQIGPAGVQMIISAEWKYMKILFLDSNPIGNKGLKIMAKGQWNYLQCLHLSITNITDKGVQYFCKGRWPKLTRLKLSCNHLGNPSLQCIFKAQMPQLKLVVLNFQGELNGEGRVCFPAQQIVKRQFVQNKQDSNPEQNDKPNICYLAVICSRDNFANGLHQRNQLVKLRYPFLAL